MLANKIQKYIFGRLLNGESVYCEKLDDNRFAFSDGFRMFVLYKEQIKFDVAKCAQIEKLKEILKDALEGVEFTQSDEIRLDEIKGIQYRKLVANEYEFSVWVEDAFVKDYKNCTFIHRNGTHPVCAIDNYGNLIAAIMPLRETPGQCWQKEAQN